MPAFMKEKNERDAAKLREMQKEIDAAEADEELKDDAEKDNNEDKKEQVAEEQDNEAQDKKLEALQKETEGLKTQLKEAKDRTLRLQADFENFRRRNAKEREELSAVVTQEFLKDLLPLLDNFERAMAAEKKDSKAFCKGVEMIYTQFREVLKKNGLEPIEAEGKKFDPNFHQAVMRAPDPDQEEDTISKELQKGYMAKGRVLRPSMVQVVANS